MSTSTTWNLMTFTRATVAVVAVLATARAAESWLNQQVQHRPTAATF